MPLHRLGYYFHHTPKYFQWLFPSAVFEIANSTREIYLTFDDGPTPGVTEWVLEELQQYDALATFFCLGQGVETYPHIIDKIVRQGHQIGNHSYSHMDGWKVPFSLLVEDALRCEEALKEQGVHTNLFRPPYGHYRYGMQAAMKSLQIIMWSHMAGDFDARVDVQKSLQILGRSAPGAIITLHDSKKAFSNLKKMLPWLLGFFAKKGYEFKTIPACH